MKKATGVRMLVAIVIALAAVCLVGGATAAQPDHDTSFVEIFNGKDLDGWDGDPRLWSVEDGVIRGETTEEKKAQDNTFLIWEGGKLSNFVLKLRFRVEEGNSGVQYRSKASEGWSVVGYQAEVNNQLGDAGELYDEGGRTHLARVGQFTIMDANGDKNIVGQVADKQHLKKAGYLKPGKWNQYTIVAVGDHLAQYVNGHQTVEVIDRDPDRRAMEGVLALQLHAGEPMAVEYKDIRLRRFAPEFGQAVRLFNEKNLDGWTFSHQKLKDTWSVRDGNLVNEGEPNGYIRTETKYTNFVLFLQFRHITKGNSGVLLRQQGPDKVWPRCVEAQGQFGRVGDIWALGGYELKTDPARTDGRHTRMIHDSSERLLGEWNNYLIVLNGSELRYYVNGVLQNKATNCEVAPGHICLQSEGAKMEYRNIVLVPIEKGGRD